MIKLTPYHFQPLFHRFVNLYIYVRYVTDCVTFVLSFLCCQCWEPPPLSENSAGVTFKPQKLPQDHRLDIGRGCGEPVKPQDLVIDFNPGREDTVELQQKVYQYWGCTNGQAESVIMDSSGISNNSLLSLRTDSKDTPARRIKEEYPEVHIFRK